MTAKLYSLSLSHPARASRLMLEFKEIDHEVVDLLPGMHPMQLRAARFRHGTVPALKVDGKRIQGSVPISRFLEHLRPQPPLFPTEPAPRQAVEEAEAWGERELQPIPRQIFRWGTVRTRELRGWIAELSGIPAPDLAATLNAPVARRFARLSNASDQAVRANLQALPAMLDRVDRWIGDGTLGGARTNAADCQIASSIRVLLAYRDLQPALRRQAVRGARRAALPQLSGPDPPAPARRLGSPAR